MILVEWSEPIDKFKWKQRGKLFDSEESEVADNFMDYLQDKGYHFFSRIDFEDVDNDVIDLEF